MTVHETLKRQFAFELFARNPSRGLEHSTTFEVAQEVAHRLYSFDPTPKTALRIAAEWVKDPVVVDTYLSLRNGEAEGEFLPTKAQLIIALANMLDGIDRKASLLSPTSAEARELGVLRQQFIAAGKIFSDLLGVGF